MEARELYGNITDSAGAERYLNETPRFTHKSTITELRQYLTRLGDPQKGMKIVHIAGTNGKGSVSSQIASCLREAGFHVGLFISPHLTDIKERMSVDGVMIPEEEFVEAFQAVLKEVSSAAKDGLSHPLYFDFLFLMAMIWFSKKKPEYLVLETGLGGRLDATNSVEEKVMTVITRIGIDHTAYLGNTIEEIAAEKAGILRKGCPAVVLTEPAEAFEVIRKKADEIGAPVYEVAPSDRKVNRVDENGIDFSLYNRYDKNLQIYLPGRALYQCENAALAAEAAGLLLDAEKIRDPGILKRGIEKNIWPGRFEEILPGVFIDGAHNPDGMKAFLESAGAVCRSRGAGTKVKRRILLFSCVNDKDYSKELQMIAASGLFTDIVAVPMQGKRALDAASLKRSIGEYAAGLSFHACDSVEDAVNRFMFGKDSDTEIYAAGSLYLVGEIRGLVRDKLRDGITEGI
ncbi:MAG TPA: bifunctional folylpolyglutamate synthase/dihydrofolate synthase [Lachnospiraceae bacterium]|nr:bifunctional folylpolyglutamate synthase/dihydrofolate synthase [Lachnospiraceae bacterium]